MSFGEQSIPHAENEFSMIYDENKTGEHGRWFIVGAECSPFFIEFRNIGLEEYKKLLFCNSALGGAHSPENSCLN